MANRPTSQALSSISVRTGRPNRPEVYPMTLIHATPDPVARPGTYRCHAPRTFPKSQIYPHWMVGGDWEPRRRYPDTCKGGPKTRRVLAPSRFAMTSGSGAIPAGRGGARGSRPAHGRESRRPPLRHRCGVDGGDHCGHGPQALLTAGSAARAGMRAGEGHDHGQTRQLWRCVSTIVDTSQRLVGVVAGLGADGGQLHGQGDEVPAGAAGGSSRRPTQEGCLGPLG